MSAADLCLLLRGMIVTRVSISNSHAAPFYVTGGTLPPEAASYIERRADRDLLAALMERDYCYVLNSRQMGKSSLCVRTIQRLRGADVQTAFIDLTKLGGASVSIEQWYVGLLSETGRELGLRREFLTYWKENSEQSLVQRYFGALRDVAIEQSSAPLVCFIDEVDIVRSLSFPTDEFFAAIRQCYNRRAHDPEYRRLSFCLLGVASPAELIADAQTTPFNIGKRIELIDFTAEEALPLAAGLDAMADGRSEAAIRQVESRAPFAAAMRSFRRILYWTGGHPYLTQVLSQAVRRQASDSKILGESAAAGVDRICRELFLSPRARETDDNLAFVRNRLLSSSSDLAALLELYDNILRGRRMPDDPGDVRVECLKLAGVVRVENGRLRPRNRIYERVFDRRWVRDNMPGADVRRQQRAFRRGIRLTMAVIGGLTALLSGAFMLWRHNLDIDPDIKIPGVKLWNTNRRNAFLSFSAAATAVIGKQNTSRNPLDEDKVGGIEGKETAQEGEAIIRLNAMPLLTLRSALNYPYQEPQIRSFDALLPYFAQFRNLARLVRLDGQVHAAHKDWGAAVSSDLDDVQFGVQIAHSTTLIGRLVGIACQAIGRNDVWLSVDYLNARQARISARRLEAVSRSVSPLAETLHEEKWTVLAGLQEFFHRADWRAEIVKQWKSGEDQLHEPSPQQQAALIRLWYTGKRQTTASFLKYYDSWIARAGLPYLAGADTPKAPTDPVWTLIGWDLSPEWCKDLVGQTYNSLLCAALALRAYRQERMAYPPDLEALVRMKILDRMPTDPFADGAALHYRRQGNGYLLYSVGPDGKDDGGRPTQPKDSEGRLMKRKTLIALPLSPPVKLSPEGLAPTRTDSGDLVVMETESGRR